LCSTPSQASIIKATSTLNVPLDLAAPRLTLRTPTLVLQVLTPLWSARRTAQSVHQASTVQVELTLLRALQVRFRLEEQMLALIVLSTTTALILSTWRFAHLCSTPMLEILNAHCVKMARNVVITMLLNLILVQQATTLRHLT